MFVTDNQTFKILCELCVLCGNLLLTAQTIFGGCQKKITTEPGDGRSYFGHCSTFPPFYKKMRSVFWSAATRRRFFGVSHALKHVNNHTLQDCTRKALHKAATSRRIPKTLRVRPSGSKKINATRFYLGD